MWRHYLTMSVRSLFRHKLYSSINVVGLAVALTCAILILLFIRGQLSYDTWVQGTENLYRLELTAYPAGQEVFRTAECPFPVLTAVGLQIPQVRAVTHVVPEQMTVIADGRQFKETVTVADPNFLHVIRLPLLEGEPGRVLQQPDAVVLSQKIARKYFGTADPVGRTIKVSGVWPDECKPSDSACYFASHTLMVAGVLRDLPHDTQLVADLVIPNTSPADEMSTSDKNGDWTATDGDYGYVELAAGARPEQVLRALKPILDQNIDLRKYGLGQSGSALEHFNLTRFRDVHLTSDRYGGMTAAGSATTVYGFAMMALLILVVAACNFMNLSTARATLRAREIAMRKVSGARRWQLVAQFLGEAVLIALIALVIAAAMVEILLPAYGRLMGDPSSQGYLSDWRLAAAILAGAVILGLGSGIYPALVLSGFRPAHVLKSGGAGRGGSGRLRALLVVAQFTVSIGLGIAALVVFRQIEFARALDLGFDRQGVVVLSSIANLPPKLRETMARVLKTGPGISATALSNAVPLNLYAAPGVFIHRPGDSQRITAQAIQMAPEFPSVYGMKLLAGRLLSTAHGEDTSGQSGVRNVLINEKGAQELGYSPRQAVGQLLATVQGQRLRVVGVLGNALIGGLETTIWPNLYLLDPGRYQMLSVRVGAGQMLQALTFIDRTWRALAPGVALQRYLVSEAFESTLTASVRQGTMFGIFVVVAILIASLGLYGLAVFTAERQMKEIGVRKVSGARTADILRLMLWRVSAPVLVANLIAWPVAYLYLHRWLEGYTDRISLSPLYFLAAGAAALLIAWATVYANTLRLARANPVRALRYE